jgi:hypothetical protein
MARPKWIFVSFRINHGAAVIFAPPIMARATMLETMLQNFGAREKLTGFARQNLPTDLASSRELMQGSDFRFRSCCPRANRNGYAHLDEDNSFAARQKSGADDIAVSTPYAAHTPKTARNAVLRVGNSIRAQMGNFWRAPRFQNHTRLF